MVAGACGLIGVAREVIAGPVRRPVVRETYAPTGFPCVLSKGDRLSVSFGQPVNPEESLPVIAIAQRFCDERPPRDYGVRLHLATMQSAETVYIAPKKCIITGVQVFYGTPPSKPAPILWMKTGASE